MDYSNLVVGWCPLLVADLALRYRPHLNVHYQLAAFVMARGFDVALPSVALAGTLLVIQIGRLTREMDRFDPKE